MKGCRPHVNRVLARYVHTDAERHGVDAPRKVGGTLVDFSKLPLPPAVRRALAEAFWSLERVHSAATLHGYWHSVRSFSRFARETDTVGSLHDVNSAMVRRYIEWLNRQVCSDGTPWHPGTRGSAYGGIRQLLRWLQRCRPQLLGPLDFPRRVFPNRHASLRREPLSPQVLRAILKACEEEITALRAVRERGAQEMALARTMRSGKIGTLGEVLLHIDERHDGIMPPSRPTPNTLCCVRKATVELGGNRAVEPCLYPRSDSIFPYYLAILIHAAGNPHAIAELTLDCLQPIPLLEDHELLVWSKGRSGRLQRRPFRTRDPFEPPALVREIIEWTRRLRPHLPLAHRNRLFVCKGHNSGIHVPSWALFKQARRQFLARHRLPPFSLSAIRPSVLTAIYRVSGDLRQAKEVANHAHLSTTMGYVQGPQVERENQVRVAALQGAFLGHIEKRIPTSSRSAPGDAERSGDPSLPSGTAVSMFGFDCKDPFAGIAPGTRVGEVCTHFLGCFTCPNAVITAEPASLARLLKARDHLRAASQYLHPARWQIVYEPQLRILEEDILTRFSAQEIAAAASLRSTLPSLPELR